MKNSNKESNQSCIFADYTDVCIGKDCWRFYGKESDGNPVVEVSMDLVLSSGDDLTDMLNIEILDGEIDYKITDVNKLSPDTIKWEWDEEFIYHAPEVDQRTLSVRRDSFSMALVLLLQYSLKIAFGFIIGCLIRDRYLTMERIFLY